MADIWHIASIRTRALNGRYWTKSGHWSARALNSSVVNDPERIDNWASVVLGKALIFRPDKVFAVNPFEPADSEMTSSHLLKMLDKRVVHGSAA